MVAIFCNLDIHFKDIQDVTFDKSKMFLRFLPIPHTLSLTLPCFSHVLHPGWGWHHRWGVNSVTFCLTLFPSFSFGKNSLPCFLFTAPCSIGLTLSMPLLGQLKCSCRFSFLVWSQKGWGVALRQRSAEEEKKERKVWGDILAFLGSRGFCPGLLEQVTLV